MKLSDLGELVMLKGRHFDRSMILTCARWYLAYNLCLRDLERMMAAQLAMRVYDFRSLCHILED